MEFARESDDLNEKKVHENKEFKPKWIWKNIFIMLFVHISAIYGVTLMPKCHKRTYLTIYVTAFLSELGITAGAHRLWTHRSYKAKLPLRIFLAACNSLALQNSIFDWSRDHRVHHKYSETNADPHNATRGFFFSHVGWLLQKKHPDVVMKGKSISVDDLYADPVVMFQKKYYKTLALFMCFILPTFIPWYFWNESLWIGSFTSIMRYCLTLNITWCVNSFAHLIGTRPYDKNINPAENMLVTLFAIGEGFHNYHHVFPHDYSTSEYGTKCNPTTAFIDIMAYIGQAYDRKVVARETILARRKRTGTCP